MPRKQPSRPTAPSREDVARDTTRGAVRGETDRDTVHAERRTPPPTEREGEASDELDPAPPDDRHTEIHPDDLE